MLSEKFDCSRPAIAKDWPSRSSITVSVRRVEMPGTPNSAVAANVSSDLADLGHQLEIDQVLGHDGRGERQADAKRLELDGDRPLFLRHRHREFAAPPGSWRTGR